MPRPVTPITAIARVPRLAGQRKNSWPRRDWGAVPAAAGRGLRGGVGNRPILQLQPGDRVTHDSWGLGTVVGLRGTGDKAQAQIDFGSAGVKWLVLRYAALEKL